MFPQKMLSSNNSPLHESLILYKDWKKLAHKGVIAIKPGTQMGDCDKNVYDIEFYTGRAVM